jgi:putative DNA primase/helicase
MNPPDSEFFVPSTTWQVVPSWAVLPNGGKYYINGTTGARFVCWNPPVPPPEAVINRRTGKPQNMPASGESTSPAQPSPAIQPTEPEPDINPAYVETVDSEDEEQYAHGSASAPEHESVDESSAQEQQQKRPARLPSVEFPPKDKRPCYINYWTDFMVDGRRHEAGVYYHHVAKKAASDLTELVGDDVQQDSDSQEESLISEWFMSPAVVDAITRTEGSREHSYILEYIPHGETERRRMLLPQALLVSRPDELAKLLRDHGLSVLHQHKTRVRDYLDSRHKFFSARRPADFWDCVKTTGWHNGAFVLPNQIIGKNSGIYFEPKGEVATYNKAGTSEQWNLLAKLALGNPYLVFGISAVLAGPLLKYLSLSGIGFHLLGDSTSGKTTTLIVGTSVWGPPEFLLSWRTTVNNLEAQCASRSDTAIILDESHLAEPRHLDAAIYVVVHGASKGRLNRDSTAKDIMRWRVVLLSTGERALETYIASAGFDHKAGQWVRIIDLPLKGAFGIFDDLHGEKSAARFADKLRNNAACCYGHAGPAFVERLTKELPTFSLSEKLNSLVATCTEPLSAQQGRVWRAFAVVALSGELASLWEILPWNTGTALSSATHKKTEW